MKYSLLFFALPGLAGCVKDKISGYPLTQYTWVVREVIHIPDNAGVGDSLTGVFYQFKTNGAYVAGNGSNNTEAKWYWIEEGVKFKVDYEGQLPANDIYTILNMNDSLLHATLRDEGEPDTTGNYWEIKYRPN